jgi:Domain of unknown function (DUF397)
MDISHLTWRKASYSGGNGGGCVEVARRLPDMVAVRDSKDPEGPRLGFALDQWRAFTGRVKAGEYGPA